MKFKDKSSNLRCLRIIQNALKLKASRIFHKVSIASFLFISFFINLLFVFLFLLFLLVFSFSGRNENQFKMAYGSVIFLLIYYSDTFDENTPPVDDPEYISTLGAATFKGMQSGDNDAVWLMQVKKIYPSIVSPSGSQCCHSSIQ